MKYIKTKIMKTLNFKIGDQVESVRFGLGTILEIDDTNAIIKFDNETKKMMLQFLKAPKVAKKKKYMIEPKEEVITFNGVVNQIKGDKQMRGSYFAKGDDDIFCKIERLALKEKHLAGDIIENARNGKFITDKQACVVAFFAKKNNLI